KTFASTSFAATHELAASKPFHVDAATTDTIRCFPIDPGFAEDTWISAANVMPGDPRVVHHVIVFSDPNGEGAAKADASGSYACFGGPGVSEPSLVLAWAPGVTPGGYGDDAALKIKKGSKLVMQVHYHSGGLQADDTTKFQLRALSARPQYVGSIFLVG